MAGVIMSMTLGIYERAKLLSIRLLIVFFIRTGGTRIVYSMGGRSSGYLGWLSWIYATNQIGKLLRWVYSGRGALFRIVGLQVAHNPDTNFEMNSVLGMDCNIRLRTGIDR